MKHRHPEEIAEADQDLPVDAQSEGMLALTSTVLAAYETLLPLFDNDERRTILFLQHVVGAVARRPFEIAYKALGNRTNPLDAIEAACRTEGPMYGSYYDIAFDRVDTGTFQMRVHRCFSATTSCATATCHSPPCCAHGTPTGCGRSTPRPADCARSARR